MWLAFSVTPSPPASSTARASSREPDEPAANRRPAWPLASISTTGARRWPGAVVPLIVVFRATAGSALDRVIVPRTANLISVRRPGRLALAVLIAARSDPGPALPSLVTVRVRAETGGGLGWWAGCVAAAAGAPPAIIPDAATHAAIRAAPGARTGTGTGTQARPGTGTRGTRRIRGTKWPLRTIVPRRVTILNTIIPLPRRWHHAGICAGGAPGKLPEILLDGSLVFSI